MVTGEEYSSDGIRTYAPFGHSLGSRHTHCSRKGICILRIVCYLFFLFIRIAPYFFSIPNIGNGLYIVLLMIPYLIGYFFSSD